VNTLRRNADGSWHGDMLDGLGFVAALRLQGCEPQGQRALLIGAGGAGSAIAHALLEAGVCHLAVHDEDATRRDALLARLATMPGCTVDVGGRDPRGYGVVLNASPAGMRAGDALPVDASQLLAAQTVGCVVTQPVVTPLIAAARALGCTTATGGDMFEQVRGLMLEFLLSPT
jgi:shikimate dehydrogenase